MLNNISNAVKTVGAVFAKKKSLLPSAAANYVPHSPAEWYLNPGLTFYGSAALGAWPTTLSSSGLVVVGDAFRDGLVAINSELIKYG